MRFVPMLFAAIALSQEIAVKNPHTAPADVAAGAKIFRAHCAECHGPAGEGDRGPKLTTGVFFHGQTDADLFTNITNGIPGTAMPAVFFSQDQLWQIVAYVRSLSQARNAAPPAGNPARGQKLFHERGCIGCHLVRGEGGVRGPDLSVIGSQRSAEYLRQAILDPNAQVQHEYWVAKITVENGTEYSGFLINEDSYAVQVLDFSRGLLSLAKHDFRNFKVDKSSLMPSFKDRLTASEVDDLMAYLWSLQRKAAIQ
jgi:putative heme-binding domain-containing protein